MNSHKPISIVSPLKSGYLLSKQYLMHRWNFLLFPIVLILVLIVFVSTRSLEKYQLNITKKEPLDSLIEKYSPPGVTPPKVTKSGFKIIGNILSGFSSVRIPILLYHYVEVNKDPKDTIRHSLTVTPYWFNEQAKYLIDHGYTTITFDDLVSALTTKSSLPPKPVILTFDDGYRDFYTDAYPILKKYNLKATNFIFPNVLDKPNNMDTWMVQEIAQSGLVTIGSHTLSHAYLPKMPLEQARKEITESKNLLERITGKPVDYFAYPYGAFDEKTMKLVQEAGYKAGIATTKGNVHSKDTLFRLSRQRVGNYTAALFQKILDE